MNNTKVTLNIITNRGNIRIPFVSLEALDSYTDKFNNQYELVEELNQLFNLDILKAEVQDTIIDYSYYNRHEAREVYKTLEPSFKKDNYNKDSLRIVVINYLCENNSELLRTPIKYVEHHAVNDYVNGTDYINDKDIVEAVDSYCKSSSYKKMRDLYFSLPPIIRNQVKNQKIDRTKDSLNLNVLSKINTGNKFNDELLHSYSFLEDSDKEEYMDEIHRLYDIEELEQLRNKLKDLDKTTRCIQELECFTKLNYDDLNIEVRKNIKARRKNARN